MKNNFVEWYLNKQARHKKSVFLTADLGYNALEKIQSRMKERFINVGVCEQNMIGVAAGLARKGFFPTCYSMVPFIILRSLEQIRNDICFNNLNVKLIGLGGGYGYGIMGPSHHSIEDLAVVTSLPHLRTFIPCNDGDVHSVLENAYKFQGPSYLRLTTTPDSNGIDLPKFQAMRKLTIGNELTLIALGPSANRAFQAVTQQSSIVNKIEMFVCSELPLKKIPSAIRKSILKTKNVLCIEEHVARGGMSEHLAWHLMNQGLQCQFKSITAQTYFTDSNGDHNHLLKQFKLDVFAIQEEISKCLR